MRTLNLRRLTAVGAALTLTAALGIRRVLWQVRKR